MSAGRGRRVRGAAGGRADRPETAQEARNAVVSTAYGRGSKPAVGSSAAAWVPGDSSMFRVRRLERGLSLAALAQQCREVGAPVSVSELSRVERHIHTPRPTLRRALADLLDLTAMDFECRNSEVSDNHGSAI